MISSFESGVCVFLPKASRVLTVGDGRTRDGVAWTKPRDEFGVTWEWLKAPYDAEREMGERVSECTYSSSTGPNEREEKYSLSATCPSASPWSHAALQTHKHTLQQLLLHQIIMKKCFGGQTAYDLFKIQWGERAESERERESEPEMQFTAFLLLLLTFISHWF